MTKQKVINFYIINTLLKRGNCEPCLIRVRGRSGWSKAKLLSLEDGEPMFVCNDLPAGVVELQSVKFDKKQLPPYEEMLLTYLTR